MEEEEQGAADLQQGHENSRDRGRRRLNSTYASPAGRGSTQATTQLTGDLRKQSENRGERKRREAGEEGHQAKTEAR